MEAAVGFIGAGNMGGALIRGVCRETDPAGVLIYDHNREKMEALTAQTGCAAAESAAEVAGGCDILMLCVKPKVLAQTIEEVRPFLHTNLIVSIAAGVTLEAMRALLGEGPMVRVMPNTPSAIGRGVLLTAFDPSVDDVYREKLTRLLSPFRVTEETLKATENPDVLYMHCLPSFHDFETKLAKEWQEKGVDIREVTDEVFRGRHSVVFDEAENRVHSIKAVLVATIGK